MSYVEVCGVVFSGTNVPADGLIYQKLTDWDGRPAGRGTGDAIPGGQGIYGRTVELRESRLITINAAIITDSASEYFDTKRRVENLPMFGEMRVNQGDGVWVRRVEIQAINIPDAHARNVTEFTIDVIAPDPVRYRPAEIVGPVGLPVRSGGLVLPKAFPWHFGTDIRPDAVIENSGSVPCWPLVTLEGAASSVEVVGGASRISAPSFSGRLVLDHRQRRAFLNGADISRQLEMRRWAAIAPGERANFIFNPVNPSPDLTMTLEYAIGAW